MSHTPVLLDPDYLLNTVLAFPSSIPLGATVMPELEKSPFDAELDTADFMGEAEISSRMVLYSPYV